MRSSFVRFRSNCFAAIFGLVGSSAFADPPTPTNADAATSATVTLEAFVPFDQTDCYATLLSATDFSWLPVMSPSSPVPEEVIALNSLLERDDADAAFKQLFAHGGASTTRLYALCGLYFTDAAAFHAGLAKMYREDEVVTSLHGKEGKRLRIRELLVGYSANVVQISQPSTATEELLASRGTKLDIAHGGIPAAIRSMKSGAQAKCVTTSQNPVIADQDRSAGLRR